MKSAVALLSLLVITARNFANITKKVPRVLPLAIEDEDGILVPLDLDAEDTKDIELTRNDLANEVKFYLYTVKNPNLHEAQQLWLNDDNGFAQSYFHSSKPTRIVIHGWMESSKGPTSCLIREAYLKHGEYNVIVVDWSIISKSSYVYASNRVKIVGQYVGKMIDFLAENEMNTMQTIIVGHSLGAHVAGLAARQCSNSVGYIVALDPALPLFAFAGPGERVAKGDAVFLHVIHTNSGILGYEIPIGDADFYPNGGYMQAGCIPVLASCSHSRSYIFFAESINSDIEFVGNECNDYLEYSLGICSGNNISVMGGAVLNVSAVGSYYLDTNMFPPYAKHYAT